MTSLFRTIIGAAWRRRFLILIPFLLLTIGSVAASILLPKTYTSTALILLQEEGPQELAANRSAASDLKIRARVAALEVLLKSDRVLTEVASRINGIDAVANPSLAALAVKDLRERLSIQIHDVYFVSISLTGSNPEALKQELDAVVARLFELLLLPSNATSSAIDFLIKQQGESISQLEARLVELNASAGDLTIAALGQTIEQRDAAAATARRADAEARQATINLREAVFGVIGDQPRLRALSAEIATLRRQLDAAPAAQKPDIEAKIAGLQELAPLEARANEARRLAGAATERLATAESVLADHRARADARDAVERELLEARAAADQLRARFRSQRDQTLRILDAPDQLKMVDEPKAPAAPTNSTLKLLFIGVAGGLGLGLGLAVLAEQLDQSVRGEEDLNAATELPVLARLPSLGRADEAALQVYGAAADGAATRSHTLSPAFAAGGNSAVG